MTYELRTPLQYLCKGDTLMPIVGRRYKQSEILGYHIKLGILAVLDEGGSVFRFNPGENITKAKLKKKKEK